MSNQNQTLIPFNYQDASQIRTILQDGEPWFVAADVCQILGIINISQAVSRLDDDERGICTTDTLGGQQDVLIVSESGLYALIFESRKPEARKFRKWVTGTVLPELRKHGYYGTLNFTPGQAVQMTGLILKLARDLASTKDAFLFKLYQDRLHAACAMLGQPVPDYNLLGKDRFQLGLELGVQS